jgi:hypothetical protein
MSQQELLGLAMNPNIDPEAAKRIVDVVQLTTPKEKETFKFDTENIPFNKNYIAFIEVPKRYQIVGEGISNQLQMEVEKVENEENNSE